MPRSATTTRVVLGFDVADKCVFRAEHTGELADVTAPEQARQIVKMKQSTTVYAVILDGDRHVVDHVGRAPCDRLLELREGAQFTLLGRRYSVRGAGGDGWGYYPGDDRPDHGSRSAGHRVAVWKPNGQPGFVTVNAQSRITFPKGS